jgi:hypothetical protein
MQHSFYVSSSEVQRHETIEIKLNSNERLFAIMHATQNDKMNTKKLQLELFNVSSSSKRMLQVFRQHYPLGKQCFLHFSDLVDFVSWLQRRLPLRKGARLELM